MENFLDIVTANNNSFQTVGMADKILKIGTRASPLALIQANMVADALTKAHPDLVVQLVPMTTTGDREQKAKLNEIGGKGLFTKEIEESLLRHETDIAVHSLKDMPSLQPDGLFLAAYLEREDPRDAFVSSDGTKFLDLPKGTVIGTASLRREAMAKHFRPDLEVVLLRGNVDTRLGKLAAGVCAATFLAYAGLKRLGKQDIVTEIFDENIFIPAVGQGIITVECREDDTRTRELLKPLNNKHSEACAIAERSFMRVLDGSCRTPLAALGKVAGDSLSLHGFYATPDGTRTVTDKIIGSVKDADKLGRNLGQLLKERL